MKLIRFAPMVLAVLAEGAWIGVVAAFMQELVLQPTALGLPHFVGASALGVVATRTLARRLPDAWPWLGLGLVVAAGIVGVLASPEARVAAAAGRIGADGALGDNPGGLLLGLALLRGYGHAHLPLGDDRLGRMFVGGTATLVLVAIVGGLVTEPFRSRFEAEALMGSAAFAGCGLLALALTRLTVTGAATGADWPRNPVWVGLLVAIIVVVEAVAVLSSGMIGPVLELIVGIAIGPLVVVGLLFGWTRSSIQAFVVLIFLVGLIYAASQIASGGPANGTTGGGTGLGGPSTPPAGSTETAQAIGLALIAIVGVVVVLVLIRAWMRRASAEAESIDEDRTIDRGLDEELPGRRRFAFHRRPVPQDAAAAYRALIADLHGRPLVAREPGETPREHARRLRGEGWGRLGLELLAADYGLSRFAGEALSATEDRRAIGRWRRLRTELRPVVPPSPERARPMGLERGARRLGDDNDLLSGRRPADEQDR